MRLSSDFIWKLDQGRRFGGIDFPGLQFDLNEAKRCIIDKPRPVEFCEIERVAHLIRRPEINVNEDDADAFRFIVTDPCCVADWDEFDRSVHSFDLNHPLILVHTPQGVLKGWPIDGWKRIAKAVQLDINKLPAVLLNPDETDEITVEDPDKVPLNKSFELERSRMVVPIGTIRGKGTCPICGCDDQDDLFLYRRGTYTVECEADLTCRCGAAAERVAARRRYNLTYTVEIWMAAREDRGEKVPITFEVADREEVERYLEIGCRKCYRTRPDYTWHVVVDEEQIRDDVSKFELQCQSCDSVLQTFP